ncbi:MAG: DUF445 family protein [Bacteroidales bacterium]|nr:DUF445 family protein [Bacteroidales bacterium]
MFHLSYIFGPLVGGVIGFITNALAIRMLFRPYTAKYIFGIKVPFTPGIIPKEKGRIALSLGKAISDNLMNKEVLEKNLLSDDMILKIRTALEGFFAAQQANDETLREFLLHYLSASEVDDALRSVKTELASQVSSRLADSKLGAQIAEVVMERVGASLRIKGMPFPGDIIQAPARNFLAKGINKMLSQHGEEIVNNLLTKEIDNLAESPVSQLLQGREEQIAQGIDSIISLYRRLISEELPRILSTINIPAIIESRVNEMDMKETEQLIFQVMNKELRAIIWLGALLGLIMGTINAFI